MPGLADILRQRQRDAVPKPVAAALRARLGFTAVAVEGQAVPRKALGRPVVGDSDDLTRILALPVRPPRTQVRDYSALKKDNTACRCAEMGRPCARELMPIQAQTLEEGENGLLGAIAVGAGKELICQLLPLVVPGVQTAILLIPPEMRESFALDWEYYGQHWVQPNLVGGRGNFRADVPRLKVIAYSELSHEKFTAALLEWKPELIIANEGHNLCGENSVRTRRVLAYCGEHPECRFAVLSGTLTRRSLRDYGHLSALALGDGSPLPIDPDVLAEWAAAIDPEDFRRGKAPALMGALSRLCRPGEDVRAAFKRRRACTPGVVDTTEVAVPNALNIHERRPPPIPQAVRDAMVATTATASRPDGEEFQEQWQVGKCLRELASGFFYRWVYPRGEPAELIERWFAARKEWNREVRELLQYPMPHLDSPLLAARAAIRGDLGREGTPEAPVWVSRAWPEWRDVRRLVRPEVEAVWVDDWLARDAAAWALSWPRRPGQGGIVWYANVAFGRRVAEVGGLPLYEGGDWESAALLRERGDRSVVCSIKAHGTGKNLQYAFSRNLVAEQPHDGAAWEQLLGRTHRVGQRADSVECWTYLHAPELRAAFERSIELAEYVEQTTPNKQKLCFASYTFQRRTGLNKPAGPAVKIDGGLRNVLARRASERA